MAFVLKATQNVELSVTITDKKGNPAGVENGVWETTDEAVVTVDDNGGDSATVSAVGTPGTATVTYTADGDLGEGVMEIVGTIDIEVVAGNAGVFNIVAGTPTEQDDDSSTPAEPAPAGPTPTTDPVVPTPDTDPTGSDQ